MNNKISTWGGVELLKLIWLENIPSYANKIYYSLGFLSMICMVLLVISGIILVFEGANWWLTNPLGIFVRSVHLWSVQAFVVFVIFHGLIVLITGGYRNPRRFVWVIGSLMFFLALIEAEFGYVLRDDFSSQWRSLQGADLYNGSGLGIFINNLNYAQIYGIHIVIIPLLILFLLSLHYALVRLRGIAIPYKKSVGYKIVKANHLLLFSRGIALVLLIFLLAKIFPSPMLAPVTIKQIALQDPKLMAATLLDELISNSGTATYLDNIDPYQFDTKKIYVEQPYLLWLGTQTDKLDMLYFFNTENNQTQALNIKLAEKYFSANKPLNTIPDTLNPVIPLISTLVLMGQSGLYESVLNNTSLTPNNPTYTLRFLSDTGVLEDKATNLDITTPQYGMLREEKGVIPPGAWWLAPLGFMDNTFLQTDNNQDQHGAYILGTLMLLFMAFPYIPVLNQLPDKLGLAKFIWKDKNTDSKEDRAAKT